MKILVERDKWSRGKGGVRLFDGHNYCILGFIGKAIGIPDAEMYNVKFLSTLDNKYPLTSLQTKMKYGKMYTRLELILLEINDSDVKDKEKLLSYYVSRVGHTLKFI